MKLLAVVVVCVTLAKSSKLPPSFKTCNRKDSNFSDCLSKAIPDALRQMTQPFKEIGAPSIEPLEIPSLAIGAGSGPVDLQQNYKNLKLVGLSTGICPKSDLDFKTNTLSITCNFDNVSMVFDYDFKGKILLLPIYGKGPGSIAMNKLKADVSFNLNEYEKDNQKHFKAVKQTVKLDPELIKFRFENLFDGDKALGENMNQVLNDNWKEIYADVRASYEDAIGQIFSSVFNRILERTAVEEIFGSE